MAHARRYFPFVQFEFPHSLGPAAGRYLMRPLDAPPREAPVEAEQLAAVAADGAPGAPEPAPASAAAADGGGGGGTGEDRLLGSADVLVVRVRGGRASAGGGLLRRSAKPAKDDDTPDEVPLTIVTIVRGRKMLTDKMAADAFLRGLDETEQERWITDGIFDLNRAVAAYRVCAADPYVFDVSRADPRAVRIGHGISEEVFAGKWTRSMTVPGPQSRRLSRDLQLAPSQGTAAVLAGQGATMESEELVLRVLLDLDQGRNRAAAVGLKGALELLLNELSGQVIGGRVRILVDEITELREPLATLALRAGRGELADADVTDLKDHAERIGATIDRWRYEPLGF